MATSEVARKRVGEEEEEEEEEEEDDMIGPMPAAPPKAKKKRGEVLFGLFSWKARCAGEHVRLQDYWRNHVV